MTVRLQYRRAAAMRQGGTCPSEGTMLAEGEALGRNCTDEPEV